VLLTLNCPKKNSNERHAVRCVAGVTVIDRRPCRHV